MKIKHLFSLLVLCTGTWTLAQPLSQPLSQPNVIAHRGFSAHAPENTLAAFQMAIDSGITIFELDVHVTSDDSLVVIHDHSTGHTASDGQNVIVDQITYQELSEIKAGYPKVFGELFKDEPYPTLREALALAKGKSKVCIELKVDSVEDAVIKTIYQMGMENEVYIFSFDYEVVKAFQRADPSLPVIYLLEFSTHSVEQDIEKALDAGASGVGVGPMYPLTKPVIEKYHAEELLVFNWTINDPAEMEHLIKIGVDGIISDYPTTVKRKIEASPESPKEE